MIRLIKKLGDVLNGKSDLLGLILSILGTLFITISIGGILCRSSTTCGGITYKLAYVTHPTILKIGLIFIFLGFAFQFFDSLITRHRITKQNAFTISIFIIMLFILILELFSI